MKRLIVKFWTINLLTAIALFVAYRIAIMNIATDGEGFITTILYILDILLNLGFALLYLCVMVLCSFVVFLNLIKKVRDSYAFSWLSFAGAPVLFVLILIINLLAEGLYNSIMTKILIFAALYPFVITLVFLMFRRALSKLIQEGKKGF